MAATCIYGKNRLEIFFSGISCTISMKLGKKHRGIKSIIIYSNDDPQLTLTYFTARSKFVGFVEHVTMEYSLEINAASDLEVG